MTDRAVVVAAVALWLALGLSFFIGAPDALAWLAVAVVWGWIVVRLWRLHVARLSFVPLFGPARAGDDDERA